MAPSSDADEPNDAASSESLTEDITKKLSLNSSTGTLTLPYSSSSITQEYSLPTLPFELIVEILSKLPVKSLIQFQCVCKSWKSLISDPKFAKNHLHMSTKHHNLISTFVSYAPNRELIQMSYPLSSVFTDVAVTATAMQLEYPLTNIQRFDPIVTSCHGILCILNSYFVLLWNPSIRKFTKLPCFDEFCGAYDFSFGYDHSSDSYKAVAFFFYAFNRAMKIRVKVHTLGTNSWRRIEDFPSDVLSEYSSAKFVCGTINWLTFKHPTSRVIISLDLEKESFLEIVQPDYGGETSSTYSELGVLRDCLCIFSRTCSDTFTDIWLMKEYGNKESWIKLFRVPDIRDLGFRPSVCALYVSEDDQVLLDIKSQFFVYNSRDSHDDIRSKLVVYNLRDGTFKDLNIQKTNGGKLTGTQVYHESLISPCF